MHSVDAVVLAGGAGDQIEPGVAFKGLVRVAGRPMVEHVVSALRDAHTVRRIAVVVPAADGIGPFIGDDEIVVSDGSFIENLSAGFANVGDATAVLVVTGDLPALTGEAVDDFVDRAVSARAEFAYAFVHESAMEAQFPGSRRTYIPTTIGRVTGGNVALLHPDVLERNRAFGQRLFETRKSAPRMAQLLGPRVVLGLAARRLRPEHLERRMGRLLDARCIAVASTHACIGADVDKRIDIEVVERVLGGADG